MRKDHRSASSRRPHGLTIVSRALAILLIAALAGCAAGSCLSYGHSCWGAHGKRSYTGRGVQQQQQRRAIDNHSDVGLIAEVEANGNAPAPSKQDRWILSRLVTGRLTVPALAAGDRRNSNTWYGAQKLLALPGNWDTDYDSTRNEIFRDQRTKTNVASLKDSVESNEDSKEFDDPFDLTRNIAEPNTETDVLLVPTRREYENRPSRTRRIKLLKILADSSDDKLK